MLIVYIFLIINKSIGPLHTQKMIFYFYFLESHTFLQYYLTLFCKRLLNIYQLTVLINALNDSRKFFLSLND